MKRNTCLAVVLILLATHSALAQGPIVRLTVKYPGGSKGYCSAVCIRSSGVFITDSHCLIGAVVGSIRIHSAGQIYPAKKFLIQAKNPGGVAVVTTSAGVFPSTTIAKGFSVGDAVTAVGLPGDGKIVNSRTGHITGVSPDKQIVTDIELHHGMSGGALLNSAGQVVGLLYGTGEPGERYSRSIHLSKITSAVHETTSIKQRIVVFSRTGCSPCRAFRRDLKYFAAFDIAIVKFGDPQYADYEAAYHKVFRRHITGVPTFWLVGLGVYRAGYDGHRDLLAWIASIDKREQGRRPGPVITDGPTPAPSPPVEQKPNPLDAKIDKLGSQVLRLGDRLKNRKPVDLSPVLKRLASIESRKLPAAVDLTPLASKVSGVAAAVGKISSVAKWLPWIAGTAGTGGVLGIVGAALGGIALLKRGRGVIRSIEAAKNPEPTEPPKIVPIAIDSPPETVVKTEQHYIPVADGTYRDAVQYAHEQLVRKYPGALGTVDFIDSIVKQYLAGDAQRET